MTEREVTTVFGSASECVFTKRGELEVIFGLNATVVPYEVDPSMAFALNSSLIHAHAAVASLPSINTTFRVLKPDKPVVPKSVLTASSQAVGVCSDLMLDGSTSSGSGGRALNYEYSVAWVRGSEPKSSLANMTALLHASNLLHGGKGAFRVHVPSETMPPGVTMDVTLRVENFIGEFHSTTVRIRKLTVPVPTLRVAGVNPRTDATFSSTVKMQAVASLPVMTCVDEDLASLDMSFEWRELTGKISDEAMGTFATKNPRVLSIPAGTLEANLNYTFEVTGFMKDDVNVTSSATVLVDVAQQALVARIAGGSSRQVGIDSDFSLDGGDSEDPDQSSVPFAFKWSCAALGAGSSCAALSWDEGLSHTSVVSIPAGVLPIGLYSFTLAVEKGPNRNDTVTTSVEIIESAPPTITISGLNAAGGKYNIDSGSIQLTSSVVSWLDYTTEWQLLDGDVDEIFVSAHAPVKSVSNEPKVLVGLSSLTRGKTYTLQLLAEDSLGRVSQSAVSLTVNEPPSSGKLVGLPSKAGCSRPSSTLRR
jgi:hypothetical protein